MKQYVTEDKSPEGKYAPGIAKEQCESVEFSIHGLECLHQFRIWNIMPESMCVLVKEDSEILGALKVGDILPLKYYTNDSFRPTVYLDTEIQHIQKEEEGRFRGHYLVGFAIITQQGNRNVH